MSHDVRPPTLHLPQLAEAPRIPGSWGDPNFKPPVWRETVAPIPLGRAFAAGVPGGTLRALVSRDPAGVNDAPLWHLSVSFVDNAGRPTRCPTWDELKHAKWRLVPPGVCMATYWPGSAANYMDVHPTTLHLWEVSPEDCQ